jgi:pyruvate formate-lyase/glycerol dehydratase family glycyl radical enzyme
MIERIRKLKESASAEKHILCIEKGRLITESFKQTESDSNYLREAKAFANVLEKITIFIEQGELIVGNVASRPGGNEVDYLCGPLTKEDIDGLKKEKWIISDNDEAEIRQMSQYWKDKTFAYKTGRVFDEERLWPFVQSGVTLPPWKRREEGWGTFIGGGMALSTNLCLFVPDYANVLNNGLNEIIKQAEEKLKCLRFTGPDSIDEAEFLKAVIIANKAVIRFANRFSTLAREMAAKETDSSQKKELERIVDICSWVPANPARGFYDAIQSFWFIFLMLNPNATVGLGRFDQYMYPFYKKDIDAGKITKEQVLELLECLRIKDMQLLVVGSRNKQREKNAGLAKWHNMTIGGQTDEGKDATNELSYLILDAVKLCQTPHHTITVRIHPGTPVDFMLEALEVVKTGVGMPAFVGDRSYIEFLLDQAIPVEKARDYALAGCLDASLTGNSRISAYLMSIVPLIFEYFLNNGVDPRTGKQLGPKTGDINDFKSFDDFMSAWKEHLAYFMSLIAEWNNIFTSIRIQSLPYVVDSSLMAGAFEDNKGMFNHKVLLENGSVMNAVGMINVVDSLASIKKIVFEEQKVTMTELQAALTANWQGERNQEIRKLFLKAPKYGNNDDYVDSIAKDLYKFWADKAVTFDTALGGKHIPAAISISAQWPGGELTGATPDGRYNGDTLADGTMSAARGADTHGPTALIKSALKIDQTPYASTLLNIKFHPSALESKEDLKKLADFIRTYFDHGGKHVQFNVVDRDTLIDAQKHPENHMDLIVRVAGYSAYFVQLGKAVQDEIINRTEYSKTTS